MLIADRDFPYCDDNILVKLFRGIEKVVTFAWPFEHASITKLCGTYRIDDDRLPVFKIRILVRFAFLMVIYVRDGWNYEDR